MHEVFERTILVLRDFDPGLLEYDRSTKQTKREASLLAQW